jgi:hypothetical protein
MGDPIDSGLLDKWYFTNTIQCATCGLRYSNRKLLTVHHDYHYHKQTAQQRRKRGLENNFRGWMEPPGDWLSGTNPSATAVQFSSSLYTRIDELINQAPACLLGSVVADVQHVNVDTKMANTTSVSAGHAAHTQTDLKKIQDSLLPESVPVDQIKTVCLECGETFEKIWISEPVDMAVYKGVVALAVGGSVPLQFRWPIAAAEAHDLEVDEDEEDIGRASREEFKIDATNALYDHRFINSLFFHKECFLSNEKIRTKEYQTSLLFAERDDELIRYLAPPIEVVEAADLIGDQQIPATAVAIVEEEDDEEEEVVNVVEDSRMIIA